jgi:alkanesulfonate monooxygenase SsuD/methylene tetrahydromethanopterin reductase-like flavin-dependent oxidoreductase (luciferase family)
MRIGLSLSSTHAVDDERDGARWMIERAAAGHEAGLDLLSVGDHHAQPNYYQNTPILGRLLAEWSGRPAGCLFLVPLWHPVVMAEHIGTLAAIHDGPFIVQTGLGYGERQYAAMGVDMRRRPSRMEEAVRVVRLLLAGETVSSELFGIRDAAIGVRSPEPVEWWIGGSADVAIDRAARLGDGWYAGPGPAAVAIERLGTYLERCDTYDRTPTAMAARADVIVTENGATARRMGDDLLATGYRGLTRAGVTYGRPAEVAEQLAPLRDAGFTDLVCRTMTVPQPVAVETISLLSEVRRLLAE